jgi:hypothetical protein
VSFDEQRVNVTETLDSSHSLENKNPRPFPASRVRTSRSKPTEGRWKYNYNQHQNRTIRQKPTTAREIVIQLTCSKAITQDNYEELQRIVFSDKESNAMHQQAKHANEMAEYSS